MKKVMLLKPIRKVNHPCFNKNYSVGTIFNVLSETINSMTLKVNLVYRTLKVDHYQIYSEDFKCFKEINNE